MKFSDLKECPFCNGQEFYTKQYAYGTMIYNERFNGEEAENSEWYEGLNFKYSGRCYCRNCNRYLGNKETDIISKSAEKILNSN